MSLCFKRNPFQVSFSLPRYLLLFFTHLQTRHGIVFLCLPRRHTLIGIPTKMVLLGQAKQFLSLSLSLSHTHTHTNKQMFKHTHTHNFTLSHTHTLVILQISVRERENAKSKRPKQITSHDDVKFLFLLRNFSLKNKNPTPTS